MNAGTVIFVGGGRIQTSTALPHHFSAGGVPFDSTGRICVGATMGIANHIAGLPRGPSGRMAISPNNTLPIAFYVAGLGITASGRLAVDETGAIHHYVRGLPVTLEGRVCISVPVVVAAGINDLDADELPDTTILDTPGGGPDITQDADSINVAEERGVANLRAIARAALKEEDTNG